MKCPDKFCLLVLSFFVTSAVPESIPVGRRVLAAEQSQLSVTAYPSIQAAVDANPGQVLWVPGGDYVLSDAVQIRQAGSGLWGPGRLLQSNPNAAVIEIQGACDVRLRDLTLTRSPDQAAVNASAIVATGCKYLSLENLCVLNNRSAAAAIRLQECQHASVVRCVVRNYMTISVDDRSASPHFGYAFHCIDGTGIAVSSCQDVLLQANRVIEEDMRPTREMKERHQLGQFSKRASAKGSLVSQATWDAGCVNNWHQGSAIVVTDPEATSFVRLLDNHIENAAQGIDIHADFVTCSGNVVVNSFMGMKAMHGSRHVLITNNQFIRNDLWSIGLMPGTASHGLLPAEDRAPAQAFNADGGSVIANNIISEFGHGDSHWIWDPQQNTCAPLVFDHGQEPDDPPLSHVLVTGNVVCQSQQGFASDTSAAEPPRYRFAVYVSGAANGPRELHFGDNLFQAGTEGVANRELTR
ncbi:MAG: right-handed parallel beta-helix repeat-containing protein [Pirellulaceae bacterium]